ncbi:addiction module toxin, RelE/StbE family [Capnocytophaga sp. oral taxon 863 str. F0517]|jgi:addiction module toxin, relE/stbE family|uniref:type II toxin-antitoxin system YafQ family toxin n=1 Tax=Capnocytophaga sp. oral taxon 863 TaxID=1227265 RepID=UPI0003966452|nr:type II toxin-antitoxin system YafQ family toxin [Capnocytophaga sp. oral taxon 863]ERI62450.1 addiction module toxin, RelE/StbE family [Capnocytophaga sp. oral taxon 863 str. F0517]
METEEKEEEILFEIAVTSSFKKDKKKIANSPSKIEKLLSLIDILQFKGVEGIPSYMKPHQLTGQYTGCLECHIESDLLLIWIQNEDEKVIYLMRLGTHSELFGKIKR